MSAIPGKHNQLLVLKSTDFGIYLDGGDLGEILMPLKYVPPGTEIADRVECFVYYDTADRIIATTEKALASVEECAYLECVAVSKFGAFLNWGLTKDLLVPFREQGLQLEVGKFYLVYVYSDTVSNRIVASTKLEKHLNKSAPDFEENDRVQLIIGRKTDKGFVAVINHTHTGLLYENEIFQPIKTGDKVEGFISQIRGDGKIDLRLQTTGYKNLQGLDRDVYEIIKSKGGYVKITDKSSPEEIYSMFKMSKKNWKKLIGSLYKKNMVVLDDDGIRILHGADEESD